MVSTFFSRIIRLQNLNFFKDVPFISNIFRPVDSKFSWHYNSFPNFLNFWILVTNPCDGFEILPSQVWNNSFKNRATKARKHFGQCPPCTFIWLGFFFVWIIIRIKRSLARIQTPLFGFLANIFKLDLLNLFCMNYAFHQKKRYK